MAQYLAPGVYVEETSYRSPSIQGVSTSTAAFIGPTRFGPAAGSPALLTSYSDYSRIYGDAAALQIGGASAPNFMAQAVQSFFLQGGSRCYAMRVANGAKAATIALKPQDAATGATLNLNARHPGAMGGTLQVTLALTVGPNILAEVPLDPTDASKGQHAVLQGASPYQAVYVQNTKTGQAKVPDGPYWLCAVTGGGGATLGLCQGPAKDAPKATADQLSATDTRVSILAIDATVASVDAAGSVVSSQSWTGLSPHPAHPRSLTATFSPDAGDQATVLYVPLAITCSLAGTALETEAAIRAALTGDEVLATVLAQKGPASGQDLGAALAAQMEKAVLPVSGLATSVQLGSGTDGDAIGASDYGGADGAGGKTGLLALADVDDISMVAAPGSTYMADHTAVNPVQQALIAHCEAMRYRVALLDPPNACTVSEVLKYRAQYSSAYAAIYYPWVQVNSDTGQGVVSLPPSGFLAGIWARNDQLYDVSHAPANLPIGAPAIGLEASISKGQQDVLNPVGVNCLRFFAGKGNLVWGARTISADTDWTYVNVRRYLCYLEHSVDAGTRWAVFQNNGPALWARVVTSVSDFLYNEWAQGHLLGDKAATAFFVKCDRTTMTQNDLDGGRLICEVGVSVLKPAEFVIFRIGQWVSGGA